MAYKKVHTARSRMLAVRTRASMATQIAWPTPKSARLVEHMRSSSSRYTSTPQTRVSSLNMVKSRMKSSGWSSTFFGTSTTSWPCSPRSNTEKDTKRFAWTLLIKFANFTILREKKSKTAMRMIKGTRFKISTSIYKLWWWLSSGSIINHTCQRCRPVCFPALSWTRRLSFRFEYVIWRQIPILESPFMICRCSNLKDPLPALWLTFSIGMEEWDREHLTSTCGIRSN